MDTPPPPPPSPSSSVPPPPPPPGAIPPPPPPPPVAPIAPPPPPSSGGGGKKILIILLCVFLGLFLLVGGCAVACTYIVAKKAKQIKAESERNPAMTALSFAVAVQPDLTVISKDESTGHMKIKNKRTGEITDIDTNQYTADNIGAALQRAAGNGMAGSAPPPAPIANDASSTQDNNHENASSSGSTPTETSEAPEPTISPGKSAALNSAAKKLPSFVTAYPHAKVIAASLNSFGGVSLGQYEFTSSDKPDTIVDFYEQKLTAQNFIIAAKNSDTNDFGPTATLIANRADPTGTCAITAESQKNGTKVSITFSNK